MMTTISMPALIRTLKRTTIKIKAAANRNRQKSEEARRKFDEVGRPTLDKMKYYIQQARACQHDLERKGLWQTIPERRKEFLQIARLMEKSTFALAVTLQNNRSQMNQDQSGSTVWAPSGQE
jgi:hypothetical protein